MGISEQIDALIGSLTAGERKAATVLKADYPFTGLQTVAEFSKKANVSSQTILRLAAKLGFGGYTEFQQALIDELKERHQSPVSLREEKGEVETGESSFSHIADATITAIKETRSFISDEQLGILAKNLGDPKRGVYILGGRISDTLGTYLSGHLKQIRSKVYKVPKDSEDWPDYLLRMSKNDILFILDFRRYQADLAWFAEQAAERGAQIVLLTDRWISPISRHSTHVLPAVIDVGTPWDTNVTALLLIETLIYKVAEIDWPKTRTRIEKWDSLRLSSGQPLSEDEDEK